MYILHDIFFRWIAVNGIEWSALFGASGFVSFVALTALVSYAAFRYIEEPWRRQIVARKMRPALGAQLAVTAALVTLQCFAGSPQGLLAYCQVRESAMHPVAGVDGIVFGDSAVLERVYMWRGATGVEVSSYWRAGKDPSEARNVGVHLVDAQGAILHQLDHRLFNDDARPFATKHDFYSIPLSFLRQSQAVGIALFDNPEKTVLIKNGNCDWGSHRLLIPVPEALRN
jgi:hypothetical protein